MIKLYRNDNGCVFYWEAWQSDSAVIVHWGKLGDTGDTREISLGGSPADEVIARESERPRSEGYRELDDEDQISLVIQYRLDNWGSSEDLQQRHHIEDLMNDCLGWTGNGHCDGGDIGSGSINVWCFVVDPHLATEAATRALREAGLLDGAVIAYEANEDYIVIWPKDHDGKFSII